MWVWENADFACERDHRYGRLSLVCEEFCEYGTQILWTEIQSSTNFFLLDF